MHHQQYLLFFMNISISRRSWQQLLPCMHVRSIGPANQNTSDQPNRMMMLNAKFSTDFHTQIVLFDRAYCTMHTSGYANLCSIEGEHGAHLILIRINNECVRTQYFRTEPSRKFSVSGLNRQLPTDFIIRWQMYYIMNILLSDPFVLFIESGAQLNAQHLLF